MSYESRVECEQLRHKLNVALQRAEAAEAKLAELAELEKQEHYVEVMKDGPMTVCHWMKPAEELPDGARLFTRPAPAADLAELVPPNWKLVPVEPTKQMLEASYREASVYSPTAYRAMLAAAPTPPE